MIRSDKDFVRRQIAAERKAYTELFKCRENDAIRTHLFASALYRKARTILCYVSFGAEVDTHEIIRRMLDDGKRVCVPHVTDKRGMMQAVEITAWSDLTAGTYGILEPKGDCLAVIDGQELDLILVPAVAFTLSGERLGMGGGFYDRYLAGLRAQTAGLAFLCQIKEKLPIDPWDRKMDFIITQKQITDCRTSLSQATESLGGS